LAKSKNRIRNWASYEHGLRQRADLTIWFSEDAVKAWREPGRGRPGGQPVYARTAIETALTVRMVLGLALRQVEGFLRSLCQQLDLDIPITDHTTLSRRARKLGKIPLAAVSGAGPLHLLVDSTGLSVHTGNQRKPPDQRPWRKLHIAVDAGTSQITAVELTASGTHDSTLVPKLLKAHDRSVSSFTADGAYDNKPVYDAVARHARRRGRRTTPRVLIPTRKGARLITRASTAMKPRNQTVRSMAKHGRRRWHKASRYSRRSLVENVNYRYKAIVGRGMRARSLAGSHSRPGSGVASSTGWLSSGC
jgi:Transposase DDE domain